MAADTDNPMFTQEQVTLIAREAAKAATDNLLQQLNLDNRIEQASLKAPENGKEFSSVPPKRIQVKVNLNGQNRWVHGYTQLEVCEDYVNLLEREGLIQWTGREKPIPVLEVYLKKFVETFKDGQAALTKENRTRIINKHIIPKMGKTPRMTSAIHAPQNGVKTACRWI